MNRKTKSPPSMHNPASNSNASIYKLRGARLLIVDDDQLIRELHARVLSLAGYEVETAEDGIGALEQLADEPFDLVLTDKHMPRLNGASIVLALRSAGSRIPVVMVSGSLAHEPLPPLVAREVFAALPKPARTAEVLSAVALALNSGDPPKRLRSPRNIQLSQA